MTPILILVFGLDAKVAAGTDIHPRARRLGAHTLHLRRIAAQQAA